MFFVHKDPIDVFLYIKTLLPEKEKIEKQNQKSKSKTKTKQKMEKVYFKSQMLVHKYWTILDHFCVSVL